MQKEDYIRARNVTIVSRCMKCAEVYRCVIREKGVSNEILCVACEKSLSCEWRKNALREEAERNTRTCHICVDRYCCEKQFDDCRGHCIFCDRFRKCKRFFMLPMSQSETSHGYCSTQCQLTHYNNLRIFSLQDIEGIIHKSHSSENAQFVMGHLSSLQRDNYGHLVHLEIAKKIILKHLSKKRFFVR